MVSVNNRTSVKDSNCPYCSGKKLLKGENDLQTLYPDIAKEWDWKLNSNKPSDYFGNSNYKVHWVCAKGHKYEAKINDRTKSKGTGCPYCAGNKVLVGFNDLQTLFPELEKEWDYEKNNRDIETISAHSGYKAWWICANNHSYLAKVNDRTKSKGTGCPYCANRKVLIGYNDLFTTEPQLAVRSIGGNAKEVMSGWLQLIIGFLYTRDARFALENCIHHFQNRRYCTIFRNMKM